MCKQKGERVAPHQATQSKSEKNMKNFVKNIIERYGYLYEGFKMERQPDCVRSLCFSNGRICFEIDRKERTVYFYDTCKMYANPVEVAEF